MDGGKHEKYKWLKFKLPQAPSLELYVEQIGGAVDTVQPDCAFRAKYNEYEAVEAAWSEAQELRDPKYEMDGISVPMAIAAICVTQISTRIRQAFGEQNEELQSDVLWKILEDTIQAVLLPAQDTLLMEMQNMRMGAAESLNMYIARIQKLEAAGWVQSDADPSLYLQYNDDGEVVAAAFIYVDDLQLASNIPGFVDSLVEEIKDWWPYTVQAADRVGIEIEHDIDAGVLSVHQATYVGHMISKYECEDEYDTLLPLPPRGQFARDGVLMGESLPPGNLCSSLVGSQNHLSQFAISYEFGDVSRYLKCPCTAHWGGAVYLLRYVRGANQDTKLHAYEKRIDTKQQFCCLYIQPR